MPLAKYPWKEIEAEVFSDDRPINFQEIAEKWKVPVVQVRKRSSTRKWQEKKKGIQTVVWEERKRAIAEKSLDLITRIDRSTLKIAEALLGEVTRSLHEHQKAREKKPEDVKAMDYRQMVSLARVTTMVSELARYHHGDLGSALNTLIESGVIPEEITPQILLALEESEAHLSQALKKVFSGRIPD